MLTRNTLNFFSLPPVAGNLFWAGVLALMLGLMMIPSLLSLASHATPRTKYPAPSNVMVPGITKPLDLTSLKHLILALTGLFGLVT